MNNRQETLKMLKKQIVKISCKCQEGHIPSAFSILDILYVLYHDVMKTDPKNPDKEPRDRLIVSKGHASIGIYAVLAEAGFFPMEELDTFCQYESRLGGHPDFHKVPGVEVSTGSLGHGLPLAVGIAMAQKFKKTDSRVFVIIGDGELNEGTNWEAFLAAKEQKLSNLVCILDYNHSSDRAVDLGNVEHKLADFGWNTLSVDGHDHEKLKDALSRQYGNDRPLFIAAHTIKGNGCKSIENQPAWHHRSPDEQEMKQMLEEIEHGNEYEKTVYCND